MSHNQIPLFETSPPVEESRSEQKLQFRKRFAKLRYSCVLQTFAVFTFLLFFVLNAMFTIIHNNANNILLGVVQKLGFGNENTTIDYN